MRKLPHAGSIRPGCTWGEEIGPHIRRGKGKSARRKDAHEPPDEHSAVDEAGGVTHLGRHGPFARNGPKAWSSRATHLGGRPRFRPD